MKQIKTNEKYHSRWILSILMAFQPKDDDLILADANVYIVARVIPYTGYNKTSENISDCNVN